MIIYHIISFLNSDLFVNVLQKDRTMVTYSLINEKFQECGEQVGDILSKIISCDKAVSLVLVDLGLDEAIFKDFDFSSIFEFIKV